MLSNAGKHHSKSSLLQNLRKHFLPPKPNAELCFAIYRLVLPQVRDAAWPHALPGARERGARAPRARRAQQPPEGKALQGLVVPTACTRARAAARSKTRSARCTS